MDFSPYVPFMIPATIFSLAAVGHVLGSLSVQAEAKQASRVGRIEGTVSRLAADAAVELSAAKAAGTTGDVLAVLKGAAAATCADYVQSVMPDTASKAGATKDSLIAMVSGEISKQQLAASAPAMLADAAGAMVASLAASAGAPAAQPKPDAAPAQAAPVADAPASQATPAT